MVVGIVPEELRKEVICPIDGTGMEYDQGEYNDGGYGCSTCGFYVPLRFVENSDSDELWIKAKNYIATDIGLKILSEGELELRISEMRGLNESYKKYVRDFKTNYEQRKVDSAQERKEKHPEFYVDC